MRRYMTREGILEENQMLEKYRNELLESDGTWNKSYNEWKKGYSNAPSLQECARIYAAAEAFRKAVTELYDAFDDPAVKDESFNENLAENYPFELSFHEVIPQVAKWVEDIKKVSLSGLLEVEE